MQKSDYSPRFKEMQHARVDVRDIKATNEGGGGFQGYGSVFGNVDLGGDVVVSGAFEKYLASFIKDGFIAVGHDWNDLGCGIIKDAVEDHYGLLINVEYHSDDRSQAVRTKVNERIAAGKSVGLSIGYFVHDWKVEGGKLMLLEIEVKEVSIVTVPMNPLASITGAKSLTRIEDDVIVVKNANAAIFDRIVNKQAFREERKEGRTHNASHRDFLRSNGKQLQEIGQSMLDAADASEKTEGDPTSGKSVESTPDDIASAFKQERLKTQRLITDSHGVN